jgi:hypothetical protein
MSASFWRRFLHIRRLCHVALHGDRATALGTDLRNDAIGAVLARRIIDDNRRTFCREAFRDSRANTL